MEIAHFAAEQFSLQYIASSIYAPWKVSSSKISADIRCSNRLLRSSIILWPPGFAGRE